MDLLAAAAGVCPRRHCGGGAMAAQRRLPQVPVPQRRRLRRRELRDQRREASHADAGQDRGRRRQRLRGLPLAGESRTRSRHKGNLIWSLEESQSLSNDL